jgi:hypothetical protein
VLWNSKMKSYIFGVVLFEVSKHFKWHGILRNNEMKSSIGSSYRYPVGQVPREQAWRQDKLWSMLPQAAMCLSAPDLAYLLRWDPALPRVSCLWTLPLCWGGLRCYHVSRSSRPRLSAREDSGATMRPMAPGPASLRESAPALPCVRRFSASHKAQE